MTKRYRLTAFAVILTLTVSAGWAARDRNSERYEQRFEKTVTVDPSGKVMLHNIAGDIKISSWAQNQVQITAIKVSRAATVEEAQRHAEQVSIEVEPEGSDLRIDTQYPKNGHGNFDVTVEYTVMVPQPASLDVGSVSGNIGVTDCGGQAEAQSVSGTVTIDGVAGPAHAKSVSGDVNIRNAGAESEGQTVSGDVTIELSQGKVSAESVSGDVEVVETSNAAMTFEASSFSGSIDSDFAGGHSRGDRRDHLSGSVNGGGKNVTLKTFSGNVKLSKR